jgi:hypothetical protein
MGGRRATRILLLALLLLIVPLLGAATSSGGCCPPFESASAPCESLLPTTCCESTAPLSRADASGGLVVAPPPSRSGIHPAPIAFSYIASTRPSTEHFPRSIIVLRL